MENRRSTPVVVRLSNYEAYLVVDAGRVFVTDSAFRVAQLRAGKTDIREYELLSETCHDTIFCKVVDRTSEDE